jgi:hypothetical protein
MSVPLRQPPPLYPPEVQQLLKLSGRGVDIGTWLTTAESSVEFLQDNARAARVVLYAGLPHVLIHGVLAPLKQLKKPDQGEIEHGFMMPDASWRIEHVSGGGRPDRVYLASPSGDGSATFKGGEQLVFRRSWAGAEGASTEISQKLVHALELHFVQERNAYCRLDEVGDIEDIIKIFDVPGKEFGESIHVVTIRSQEFYEYACLAGMGLVFLYDFTRFRPGSFGGWSNQKRFERSDPHLFYNGGVQPGVGSYINGRLIIVPAVTKREIVRRYKERRNPTKRRYAAFKALNLKTTKLIEASCDPKQLSNYFQPDSDLPLQITPAFFRAEVLHKYKADPSKYELTDRSISCRGAWHLQTYDVNEVGQVHTYLRYLGHLPYPEQLYWLSFNEWPKGPISRRAVQTDFMGEFSTDYDPLLAVKRKVGRLDEVSPAWWKPRGRELARLVHYPVTGSEAEWADAILALDQLVIEGFQDASLKKLVLAMGKTVEKEWRSLKLMEECLVGRGVTEDESKSAVDAMRIVHDLRTIVKGHAAPQKKADAVKKALISYRDFRTHFETLAAGCDEALGLIMETMDISKN